jgi:hypothetical protein
MMVCGVGALALLAAPCAILADGDNASPEFKEVYELIRAHLAGENDADLNQAAVRGLLQQLHTKVALVSGKTETNTQAGQGLLLPQSAVYDGSIAYLRVGRVGQGLAEQLAATCKGFGSTNKLAGIILDLRFAGGHDYAEAASVADLFMTKNKPLMDWGNGFVRSKEKSDAFTLPVAILVNQHTAAAAEALAAVLRQSDGGMILGSNTAGEATAGKDFPLKNGQFLRIATAAVKLADGEMLSANGIKPDIQVAVSPEEEHAWFANPYKQMPSTVNLAAASGSAAASGNSSMTRTNRTRMTEADLIRERKERPGLELEYNTTGADATEPEKPTVRDPVLARALDLIKGISAMRQSRS